MYTSVVILINTSGYETSSQLSYKNIGHIGELERSIVNRNYNVMTEGRETHFFCSRLPGITKDYLRLPGLPEITKITMRLPKITKITKDYQGLPGITKDYQGLPGDYQGITRDYHGITMGLPWDYRGITLRLP